MDTDITEKTYDQLNTIATELERISASLWDSYARADTQTSFERDQCREHEVRAKQSRFRANEAEKKEGIND